MVSFGKISNTKKVVGTERRSKLTRNSGCGALVDMPGFSGIMGGINLWPSNQPEDMIIHEKKLEEYLGKDYFVQPSSEDEFNTNNSDFSVPILRFPDYYYCPRCHELDYARKIAKNLKNDKSYTSALLCSGCGTELIPSRFVVACEDGHIDEFPYARWAHKGQPCNNPRLKLENRGKSSGLDSIIVSCESCGAENSMANCLNREAFIGMRCFGSSPWLGKGKKCECGKPIRAIMRGASNVYYPKTASVLTIPPWSSAAQKLIDENYSVLQAFFAEGFPPEMTKMGVASIFNNKGIGKKLHCTEEDFYKQVNLRFNRSAQEERTEESLLVDEYKAFMGPDVDDIFFRTETAAIAPLLRPYFDKIKLVHRLREVSALYGFTRISESSESCSVAKITDGKENWLPATEMLGEGIFFSFSKEALQSWSEQNKERYERMRQRFMTQQDFTPIKEFSPELVCVHTFAHLIMRELTYKCGYDATSIKEKLYVSTTGAQWMAGVLIYTVSACSDGSLGGLVRQGRGKLLRDTVLSMVNRAGWCSNDPICLESTDQGMYSLNYAACHACTYVSEVSCRFNNTLLDRQAVVGGFDTPEAGYFGGLIE